MRQSSQSQFQNVFRLSKPDGVATHQDGRSKVMRRNRQTLSCQTCKFRKLKCDRQAPCSSCTSKGMSNSCSLIPGNSLSNSHSHFSSGTSEKKIKNSEAQIRLQQLEALVANLMEEKQLGNVNSDSRITPAETESEVLDPELETQAQLSPPSSEGEKGGHGVLEVVGVESRYRGSTHWATILANIRDIQDCFEQEAEELEEAATAPLPICVGIANPAATITLNDTLNALPPRAATDKLLSIYLSSDYFTLPIIHTGKFMREYNEFWENPSSVSFLWISILFSMLCLASQVEENNGSNSSKRLNAKPKFYAFAGNALVAGQYHKAKPYSIEAVLFYGLCSLWRSEDSSEEAWMIMGLAARLAFKMGYHRDPSLLPNITPFEGEMRRRVFYLLETFDLLLSFQAGLPAVIHEEDRDAASPGNYFDSDLKEDCLELPPSRPITDHTPMTYSCHKNKITRVFKKITRHAVCPLNPSVEETWRLDREIRAVHDETPPSLRIKPLNFCLGDKFDDVLHRLHTELAYLKARCVLHRRFITQHRDDPAFDEHRTICSDSALRVLSLQAEIHHATEPDGLYFQQRWMVSSISMNDFLLAAMITALELHESLHTPGTSPARESTQTRSCQALKKSYQIWVSRSSFSKDARRGARMLAAMLAKVPLSTSNPASVESQPASNQNPSHRASLQNIIPDENSGIWDPVQDIAESNMDVSMEWMDFDPLDNFLGGSVDWGLLDQYVNNNI